MEDAEHGEDVGIEHVTVAVVELVGGRGGDGRASGDTGKSGAPGPGGDGGEQAIQAAFAPTVDGPNDGPKDLRTVPEPGSILLALGAAAAIVRRRMR